MTYKGLLKQPVYLGSRGVTEKLLVKVDRRLFDLELTTEPDAFIPFYEDLNKLHTFIHSYQKVIPKSGKSLMQLDEMMMPVTHHRNTIVFHEIFESYCNKFRHFNNSSTDIIGVVEKANKYNVNDLDIDAIFYTWDMVANKVKRRPYKPKEIKETDTLAQYTRKVISNDLYQFNLQIEAAHNRNLNKRIVYAGNTLNSVLILFGLFKKCGRQVKESIRILMELEMMFNHMNDHMVFMTMLTPAIKDKDIKKAMNKHKPVHLSDEQFDNMDDIQVYLTQLHNLSLSEVNDSIKNINFFYQKKLSKLLEDINQSIIKIR